MELKAIAIAALCVGFNGLAVAGAMGGVVPSPSKFYIGAEGGASISLDTQFAPKWGGYLFVSLQPETLTGILISALGVLVVHSLVISTTRM